MTIRIEIEIHVYREMYRERERGRRESHAVCKAFMDSVSGFVSRAGLFLISLKRKRSMAFYGLFIL